MWNQNSKKLNPFARFGCYFTCLGYVAEKASDIRKLSPEEVWEAYVVANHEGWMDVDCYIKSPQKIIKYFLSILDPTNKWIAEYVGWWNVDTGEVLWDERIWNFEVLRDDHGSYNHFYMEDFEPHFGKPSMPSKGLSGKRYFLVQKERR